MGVYAKLALAGGSISAFGITVTLRLPSNPKLLQVITTFPFNVILVMMAVLVIGTVFALTRKPARLKITKANVVNQPTQETEEEIPRRFEDYKDGINKLYYWFYRFTQRKFEGIADNMTPREFMMNILSRIPSDEALTLGNLVTVFEIANYSNHELTQEMCDRSLRAVESLKDIIEGESSHTHVKPSYLVRARSIARARAMYGTVEAMELVRQRYWKWCYHRTGPGAGEKWYKRRVWKTPKGRFKKVVRERRYEFSSPGKDLYRAIVKAHRVIPKGFIDVSAEEFLRHPELYDLEGEWIDRKIES